MKHYTRKERRIRRGGYDEGYAEGYKQGLHDGNLLIAIAEEAAKAVNSIIETFNNPEFQEACREYLEEQKKDYHQEYWDHIGEENQKEEEQEADE